MAHILLVEDEEALERIFALNLKHHGHVVDEAGSVAAADRLVSNSRTPFDLLILDINLPDQTGWEFLRHWHEHNASPLPPVIVTTAVRPSADRLKQFEPCGVLVKPFPIQVLLQLTDRMLTFGRCASDSETSLFE